ncbi:MAG: TIGR03545 family protein, partial [Bdellovibrionales bacterium]|nr:TIGR03545 family protein [Bdellovibrionales bacterium]
IHLDLLWDALLRGKVVIPTAGITNIALNTARSSPGRVLPKDSVEGSARSEMIQQARELLLKRTPLGDLAKFIDNFDPKKQLADIKGELKALKKIQALTGELDTKQAEWEKTLGSLPAGEDFAQAQSTISGLKASKNPMEIKKQIDVVQGTVSGLQKKLEALEKGSRSLTEDVNRFAKETGSIDDVVREDIRDAEGKLQIPSLEPKDMAKDMFGPEVLAKTQEAEKYASMARDYMPPKSEKKEAPKPAPRATGRVYEFGRPNGYPVFWMKRAEISSKLDESAEAGELSGELRNVASNQVQTGLPTELELQGAFPRAEVSGLRLKAVFDHRTDKPVDSIVATVGSFPVSGRDLSRGGDVTFGFGKAVGSAEIEGALSGGEMLLRAQTAFRQVKFEVKARSAMLDSALKDVARELTTVTVKATAKGTADDLDISVESNLADAIARGLARQLQTRLAEARAKIKAMIDEQVMGPKRELVGRVDAAKAQVLGQVTARKKQAEAAKATADKKIAELKKSLTPDVKKKGVGALKKKLKF